MTPLPPHLDRLHDELMDAARARTAAPRRRPTPRLAAVVAFAVLATGGVALAATSTNPIDWLRGGDPARELRVAPDDAHRVDGDFTEQILCPAGVDGGEVDCRRIPDPDCTETTLPDGGIAERCTGAASTGSEIRAGERSYDLMTRVSERPRLGPGLLRTALRDRAPDEILFPDAPARYRLSVRRILQLSDGASPEFWERLGVMLSVQGGTVSDADPDRPGRQLVPPPGVRRFITCTDDGGLRCRALDNGELLPVGAPLYHLRSDATWRSVPERSDGSASFLALQREVFGRELTADEQILVIALLAPVVAETSGSGGAGPATRATPAP